MFQPEEDTTTISVNGGPEVPMKDVKKVLKEMKKGFRDILPKTAEGTVSGARLKSFIERIERLAEEQKALGEDVRDIYQEVKATGFEPKIVRRIISLRKVNLEKRREEAELTRLYAAAIGQGDLFE